MIGVLRNLGQNALNASSEDDPPSDDADDQAHGAANCKEFNTYQDNFDEVRTWYEENPGSDESKTTVSVMSAMMTNVPLFFDHVEALT